MKVIYKYEFDVADEVHVQMPLDSQVIDIGKDPNGNTCIWAIVDPDSEPAEHIFFVHGTGHKIPEDSRKYLMSFQDRPFVWHVFQ